MNENENEILHQLEQLLLECNDSKTSNERRKEIEKNLDEFSSRPDAVTCCLKYLAHTTNEYVIMFCLHILENHIKKWFTLPVPEREAIREVVCSCLLQSHKHVPNYVQNKLGEMVVDIGRHDWPHAYPDFFTDIYKLAQDAETVHLGLMLILTVFEELSFPRDDLHASKKEFERLVLEQVPTILSILCGYLDKILEKNRHQATATPPPSPTHSITDSSENSLSTAFDAGTFQLSVHYKPPPLDSESCDLCFRSLQCLSQMLSWAPLSSYITPSLMSSLFYYASFAFTSKEEINSSLSAAERSHFYTKLGDLAMSCMNEIMSRNCLPAPLEKYLLQMLQNTSIFLRYLNTKNDNSPDNSMIDVHESFLVRFHEYLQFFMNMHLKRLDQQFRYPVLEFLSLFYKYSFQQAHSGFTVCLNIWSTVVDFLHVEINCKSGNKVNEMLESYKSVLLALADGIFQKILFRFNQSSLEALDDEFLDDDEETEWHKFLHQCLYIVSNIGDLMPDKVFQLTYGTFEDNVKIYLELERFVVHDNSVTSVFTLTDGNDCRQLHYNLRDLSSALQAIGYLMEHLTGANYNERKKISLAIIEKLIHATEFSNKMRFYDMISGTPLELKTDFIDVHAQLLGTLKGFCNWLVQHKQECAISNSQSGSTIESTVVGLIVPNIQRKVPLKVVRNALYFFQSLTSIVRPQYLFQLPVMTVFFQSVCDGQYQFLTTEDYCILSRCMTNILLLPYLNGPEPDSVWGARSYQHQVLMSNLCRPLVAVYCNPTFFQDQTMQDDAKPSLLLVLRTLVDVISSVADTPNKTKDAFYQSILDAVPMISGLFPIYFQQAEIAGEVFHFFIYLFGSLKSQVGKNMIQRTVDVFLSVIRRISFGQYFETGNIRGVQVLEKFLELLSCVVSDPSVTDSVYLEGIVHYCLTEIHPLILQFHLYESDISLRFFRLLRDILVFNWHFFVRTSPVTQDDLMVEVYENTVSVTFLVQILQTFLKALDQPEIMLCKQIMGYLVDLNNKCRLFERRFFRETMVAHFLHAFLTNLVRKTHGLLEEEIISIVYNMASVNFGYYFFSFIPQFIDSFGCLNATQKTALLTNLGQEMDLPTFGQNVQHFVSEFRFFCSCQNYAI